MISVVILFCYMLITALLTGFGILRLLGGKNQEQYHIVDLLFAGTAVITVYAECVSIFTGVGLTANILLLVVCILLAIKYHREIAKQIRTDIITVKPGRAIVITLLFLLFAYGTSRGLLHYDTSLYHAQSIHWIEDFGAVKGLGNLHSRLAYNSSAFCLSAFYSMSFLGGQSFHCCAGFLAFLLALLCIRKVTGRRHLNVSDFAGVAAIYYLLNIFDEMISPASDYFMVLFVFYIVIRWLEFLECKTKAWEPYAWLSVLCVFVVSIKLSGALLVLLAVKPVVILIKEKKWRSIVKYLSAGLLTIIPFLVRNVILSGWLVYPFTGIDLFSFSFKIPKEVAAYDAREIQVWGRGGRDVASFSNRFADWFPSWFSELDRINQFFFVLAVCGIILLIIQIIRYIIGNRSIILDEILVETVISGCFLFWLCSAPLIRYGCVFLWLTGVISFGSFYLSCTDRFDHGRVALLVFGLFFLYKEIMFFGETVKSFTPEYFVLQKDYENRETQSYQLHGYTFYYPVVGDQTGYRDFPASPIRAEDIFIGDKITDGFRDVIH